MKIKKLPEHIARCIAAGEVVDRPASVLKELVENAVDAGAHHIVIEWEEAGRRCIRVTDDGVGMTPEDAVLSLERHATSKLVSLDDLERIGTFGFRGEALPSIAAVSRFQLITRPSQASEGWSIQTENGCVVREGPQGAPFGTTVLVEDLFHALPARLKFLKSDASERAFLLRTVEDMALTARAVHFQVFAEKKEILFFRPSEAGTPPEDILRDRLETAWGSARLESSRLINETGPFMKVWGWISPVHASQATGRYQRFFINNRPVTHRRFTHGLYDSYRGNLSVGRHPLAALFLEVDPTQVDVNVHPAKREVRLSQESEMYGFLLGALRKALAGGSSVPEVFPTAFSDRGAHRAEGRRFEAPELRTPSIFSYSSLSPTRPEVQGAYALQAPAPEKRDRPLETEAMSLGSFRQATFDILTQMDATYIFARAQDRVFIIDQHAACEQVLYEKLVKAAENQIPHRQVLLLPWVWEVSRPMAAVVQSRLEDLMRLGYSLESFGENSFRVHAVPSALGDSPQVRVLLEGLADDLVSEKIPKGWEALLMSAACRGSIRAGAILSHPEMARVLTDLQQCTNPWSCPHGRPTFLRLSPEELAKRFKR
jgi:DNA mismatch repair protein MutL